MRYRTVSAPFAKIFLSRRSGELFLRKSFDLSTRCGETGTGEVETSVAVSKIRGKVPDPKQR